MGPLFGQDDLVRASLETAQTALTVFRLVNVGMAVEAEIYLSENVLRASLHAGPTGLAAAGIQVDIISLCMTRKRQVKFHFLFL